MAWFRRRPAAGGRSASREDLVYLEEFVRSRRGVEGFIEPRTTVTETTLLLIAHDGEWTRRRMASPQAADRLERPLVDRGSRHGNVDQGAHRRFADPAFPDFRPDVRDPGIRQLVVKRVRPGQALPARVGRIEAERRLQER